MEKEFIPKLLELAEKYRAAEELCVIPEEGAVKVKCSKGAFRFFYDLSLIHI